ncbi:hypothetical protein ACGFNU_02485 [Spirillospora sp. NPDC048911]|uniref:hypothetical protein n=1 Tax=Spirillospora sp. NPDC048911 TaxID=3364527 RepID=UPI0037160B64
MAAQRVLPIAVILTAAAAVSACSGGGDERFEPVRATGRAALAGTGYTSDQLEQALLLDVAGYQRTGEPDSGEYGALKAVQNSAQLQRQVRLDKPRCANAVGGAMRAVDPGLPAAVAAFSRGSGQIATQTLVAMPTEAAERLVRNRVPVGCTTFRTRVGAQWSDHQVVEVPPGTIGEGSRTVGVTTVSGSSHTRAWYVVLYGRRYLATVSLYGPNATRSDAELLARQAYDQAQRILP